MKNQIYSGKTLEIKAKDIAFNALFHFLPISFSWIDKEGYILGHNQTALDYLKVTSSITDIIGRHASEITSKNAWENTKKVLETGEMGVFDEFHLDKNRNKTYFLSIKSPIKSCDEEIIGVVVVAIDISDRKLMEIQLEKEKEAAQLSDKVKTEFLSNMRHDLRTPLSGIFGISEFLEKNETDSGKKSYLQDIKKCSEAVIDHLNDIIAYINVENGNFRTCEKLFDIHHLLKDVYSMLIPMANIKKLEFKLIISRNLPHNLIGDPSRTQRILMNIISNSLKFTEKGHVKIQVNWFFKNEAKGIVQFIIEDTGIGIPDDKKDIIFEKFTRLNHSYKNTYKGSGLGLNIVKQFLEEVEGQYTLNSELQKGTQFVVNIPYNIPLLPPISMENNSGSTNMHDILSSNLPLDRKVNKILLVEDHQIIARISKDMLEKIEELRCDVHIAETGQEALELWENNKYDLILLDIGLPDIDGYTVAKYIREKSEVPIVAITAHTEDEQAQKCLDIGINKVIIKPLTDEIAKSMKHYL